MKNENVILHVELDSHMMEVGVKELSKALGSLNKLVREVGNAVAKAFDPFLASIQKISAEVSGMTVALENATEQIGLLMDQLAEEQAADQMLETISAAIEGISVVTSVTELISQTGMLKSVFGAVTTWVTGTLVPAITSALGTIATALGISVGWVVAIIAAVIAAIVAVIVYWDEIKLFFTETLPQLWSQFV